MEYFILFTKYFSVISFPLTLCGVTVFTFNIFLYQRELRKLKWLSFADNYVRHYRNVLMFQKKTIPVTTIPRIFLRATLQKTISIKNFLKCWEKQLLQFTTVVTDST